jgi:hypothetical protein
MIGVVNEIFLRTGSDRELSDSFKWWFFPICFAIYYPLVLIRKLEGFAKFHVFGDVMIWITIIAICIYAGYSDANNGWGS